MTDRPLPPLPGDHIPHLRTHEWLGLDDDSRCADCMTVLSECDSACSEAQA